MTRRGLHTALIFLTAFFAAVTTSFALTPSGTSINNRASAVYSDLGGPYTIESSPTGNTTIGAGNGADTAFVVDAKIDFTVAYPSGAYVAVSPGSTARVLDFTVTNNSNELLDFSLEALVTTNGNADPLTGTDNFNASNVSFYVDSNGNGVYDAGTDTAASINDLAAGASIHVFIVADIPPGQVSGDIAAYAIRATALKSNGSAISETAGADNPATIQYVFADGDGDEHAEANDLPENGKHVARGAYLVAAVAVSTVKTSVVKDPYNGSLVIPGATISYTLTVTVTGSGTATGVVITDPIPANTTYTNLTLKLNGGALSDGVDADAGDYNFTTPGAVTVTLGNITAGSPAKTITFDVTIN